MHARRALVNLVSMSILAWRAARSCSCVGDYMFAFNAISIPIKVRIAYGLNHGDEQPQHSGE